MLTWNELKGMENRFEIVKDLKADAATLERIQKECVQAEKKVIDSVAEFADAVGMIRARVAIASLVNSCSWDGRISRSNAAWAADTEGALDEECCQHFGIYTAIHRAHLDQLVSAFRRLEKEQAEAPADPVPAAEERPEIISESVAPETVTESSKAARGPVKEKDFAGGALTGNGWSIVFDTGMNRTRVIVADALRETLKPLIESAGFFYSKNQGSWNKKLTHRAHRAALDLADSIRAALV
ncbi:MAG: DUF3849 domain-containing protein [Clostridia bacterium]|nr:DUF3849 domain-containing protein [Clostridia bacterium]